MYHDLYHDRKEVFFFPTLPNFHSTKIKKTEVETMHSVHEFLHKHNIV